MNLLSLQQQMQAYVLGGDEAALQLLHGADVQEGRVRADIYRDAYGLRLTEALGTTFAKVKRALGEQAFMRLCIAFAREQPSRYASVRDYGANFPGFLKARHRGLKAEGLTELAGWEWATAAAFDAKNAMTPLPVDLSGVAPDRWSDLRFTFAPSLHRTRLTTNAIRWVRTEDDAPPKRWRRHRPTEWVIWRKELTVYFRSLTPDEAIALDRARAGATFGELCAELLEICGEDQAPMRAATFLRTWIEEQLLVAVDG